ncbi:hypothetical protein JKL49_07380 [Phenylobacterium sp. 20VBR1]|uniref:Uncharacterized protein n=1 Tax=Phenylobacterium glaciei TaxID=2803784 RepID=A0A941D2T4_9CAUL|nr:hypothetical protein [Phenylobacterium glaciei]MBR7619208.1 hypothetical protein [Phenylobacterium glaciei]
MTDAIGLPSRRSALRWLLGGALIAATGLGLVVVNQELSSARAEAATVRALGGPRPLPWEVGGDTFCVSDCPPRARAAIGVRLTTEAAAQSDPAQRRLKLAEAERQFAGALAARPDSGGWWAWVSYARALDGRQAAALDALTRSYVAAPFLPMEAAWRIRYGALNWDRLTPTVRAQVVNETVWMRDVDPTAATGLFTAFTDPRAASALNAGLARPVSKLVPHRRSGSPGGEGPRG